MADTTDMAILEDLKEHLRTARIPHDNLSALAQKGDEKLVENIMSDKINISGTGPEAKQSQLYVASFWGFRDIVKRLFDSDTENLLDVNAQNKGTNWTSLHAATFQEHGPIVMLLLSKGARPDLPDSEGRTPKDFASASDKIWPHFAALNLKRTNRAELMDKCIVKKVDLQNSVSPLSSPRQPGDGIQMAAYSQPETGQASLTNPALAAMSGDVLADDKPDEGSTQQSKPQLDIYN